MLAERGLADRPLTSNAGLFAFEISGVQGVGVERIEQLLALLLQLDEPVAGAASFGTLLGHDDLDVFQDDATDLPNTSVAQCDSAPVVGDQFFQVSGLDSPKLATVLQSLPTEAVEVVVQLAFGVSALFEGQRLTATAAVDRALQVVGVDARFLAALVPGLPHPLDIGEQGFGDERLVLAVVLDALEGDFADVVAVAEDGVEV